MNNKNQGLTLSIICELESANYGEGGSNYSPLKKISRADGNIYTYISRQALRYSIIEQLVDEYDWKKTEVEAKGKGNRKVVQFAPNAKIKDFAEIDLFGYMKTNSDKDSATITRSAVVRLSNAISMEPYNSNLDFLTNSGIANRKYGLNNSLVQVEIHKSLYTYTIAIDLNGIGIDENEKGEEKEIENTEKAKRVKEFLQVLKTLYRNIRGRRENLTPIFVIGGIYNIKNPFFENKLHLIENSFKLDIKEIKSTLEDLDDEIKENTIIGYSNSILDIENNNSIEIKTIKEVFDLLYKKVDEYYV